MITDENRQIVELAYSAALDDGLWKNWATQTIKWLGGVGGTLSVLDPQTISIHKLISVGWSDAELDYHAHWGQYDPLVPAVLKPNRAYAFLDTDHVNESRRETAEYMDWQRNAAGFDHHLAAAIPLGSRTHRAAISVHRSSSQGHTPQSDQRKLEAILPSIQNAMQLAFAQNELIQNEFWNGITIGKQDQIAFLLDDKGKVIRCTDSAEIMIADGDGIDIVKGKLTSYWPSDDCILQKILGQAISHSAPEHGAARLQRRSGRLPLIVTCFPLPRSSRMLAPAEAAALVSFIDTGLKHRDDNKIYQQAFGMTLRESALSQALLNGHSAESAAAKLNISIATVRTHLRNIFEKTSSMGQLDLIRILSKIR